MAAGELSIEEFIPASSFDDDLAMLIGPQETSLTPSENASISKDHAFSRVLYDFDLTDLNTDKGQFDKYFPGLPISHEQEMLPVGTAPMLTHLVNLNGVHENIDRQLVSGFALHRQPRPVFDNHMLSVFRPNTSSDGFPLAQTQTTAATTTANRVPLSGSVQVKELRQSSRPIEVVCELEEDYRPRYKSDYFTQDGTVRFPRYVADRHGNNVVTLKIAPGKEGFIRTDWTTIEKAPLRRYSMPYKFQVNNFLVDVKDCNPIYCPIKPNKDGIMELQLVLIKSKQSELEPLQPFPPTEQPLDTAHSRNVKPMPPKQMIKYHQLEQSQLAFTFCPRDPNGEPGIAEWGTTVYSTVLIEQPPATSKKRAITCPKCRHVFPIIPEEIDDIGHEQTPKKRKN